MRHWLKINLFFIFVTLLISTSLFAQSNSQKAIERFDIGQYRPQKFGLKDLVFDVRIPNLLKSLNASGRFGKLNDLYFKVYWVFPNQFEIDVIGLPASFTARKSEFVGLIKDKLDFVIPQTLESKLEDYQLKFEKNIDGSLIRGFEKSQKKAVSEFHVFFNKQGKMSRTKIFSTGGVVDSKFTMDTKAWSNNKWVVEKISTQAGGVQDSFETLITYSNIQGYGLPKVIEIHAGDSTKTKIVFEGYEVNTGKALKQIKDGR